MQISVPVTFDATNQTMSVSDSDLITFPQNTSDFSIVTVNGMDCITPTTVSTSNTYYVQFEIASSVEETEFDAYIDISNTQYSFNYWFELVSNGSPNQYSLVYNSGGVWWNPDRATVNLPTQQWYTVKIVNNDSIKIYDKSTGNLVHSRSFAGSLNVISLANFYGATSYLANLVLKRTINTGLIRYVNITGIAEIWANIKNWVLAHIGNGTLTIQKNGTNVTTFSANSSSNATANITVPTKVSDLTNDSGFLTSANIPSKTSDLVNDSGFLTSHQSLSNYVTLDGAQTISGNKTFTGTLTGDITGNCSGSSGSCTGNAATATQFSANKSVTLTGDVTGTASSKAGWSVATTLANSGVTAGTYGPSADVTGNNNATISVPQITVDAKGRVTSVVNKTLTCKNNTYTVNNATLTIQKNGTNVATFTSNASSNATANITVPTKVSELTNDSKFTSCLSSGNGINFDWSTQYTNKVGIKVDNTWVGGILTTTNTTIPTKTSQLTNDSGFLTSHQDLSLYPYKLVETVGSYKHWPFIDLGNTTTYPNGFNDLMDIGKFDVRVVIGTTPNAPSISGATHMQGILEVEWLRATDNTSAYKRIIQKFHRVGATTVYDIYIRRAYRNSSSVWVWAEWEQVVTIDDIPKIVFAYASRSAIANAGNGSYKRVSADSLYYCYFVNGSFTVTSTKVGSSGTYELQSGGVSQTPGTDKICGLWIKIA